MLIPRDEIVDIYIGFWCIVCEHTSKCGQEKQLIIWGIQVKLSMNMQPFLLTCILSSLFFELTCNHRILPFSQKERGNEDWFDFHAWHSEVQYWLNLLFCAADLG